MILIQSQGENVSVNLEIFATFPNISSLPREISAASVSVTILQTPCHVYLLSTQTTLNDNLYCHSPCKINSCVLEPPRVLLGAILQLI